VNLPSHPAPSKTLYGQAREYLDRGWLPFPLKDKRPALSRWDWLREPENRPGEQELRDWFGGEQLGRINGIAIITGQPSARLVVRDWDSVPAYKEWARSHPALAVTLPTVQTGRGLHCYFAAGDGASLYRRLPDGELIGNQAHFVVAPGSWHPTARKIYQWVRPLPPIDQSLPVLDPVEAGLLPPGTYRPAGKALPRKKRRRLGKAAGIPAGCLPTGPGQSNSCLLSLVQHLDRVGADREQVEHAFTGWWQAAQGVVRTSKRELHRKLVDCWERSQKRLANGQAAGVLGEALAVAESVSVPERWQRPPALARVYRLVGGLARLSLQSTPQGRVTSVFHPASSGTFFLSCHLAADLLGIGQVTAWRHLRALEAGGVLRCLRRGDQYTGGEVPEFPKATEWRFSEAQDLPSGAEQ